MTRRTFEEIEHLIEEAWRRIETSKRIISQARNLVEQSRRQRWNCQRHIPVRLHAECAERTVWLSQISSFTHIGRLYEACSMNGIAAAIHFDPDRGVEIRLEQIDRHTFERLIAQVPLELV